MAQVICPRCKHPLKRERDADLKREYKYYCPDCDENFYEFEAIKLFEPEVGADS